METWKGVPGYSGLYEVSDLGRVRSLGRMCRSKNTSVQKKRARILVQEITIHGYCRVRLFDANGEATHKAVHRLVAETFIRPMKNGEQVNHLNEIKTDNRVENLEICTPKENCNYGSRNRRIAAAMSRISPSDSTREKIANVRRRPVKQLSKDGDLIAVFNSAKEAHEKTGVDTGHISSCRNGKRKSAGGYVWRFA